MLRPRPARARAAPLFSSTASSWLSLPRVSRKKSSPPRSLASPQKPESAFTSLPTLLPKQCAPSPRTRRQTPIAQEELRVLVDAVLVHGVHEGGEAAASEGQGPVVLRALAHRDVIDLKRVRVEQAEPVPDGGAARPVRGGEAELFPVRREAAERNVRIFAREEAVSAVFIYAEAAAAAVHEAAAVEPEGQLVYDPHSARDLLSASAAAFASPAPAQGRRPSRGSSRR